MLRISGTTRLLRSGDVSPYQNIHNSLAPLRVLNPFEPCCVLVWGLGKPLGNDGGNADEPPGLDAEEADGILLQTQRMSFERHRQ
jgi:hypothetical protein